MTAAFLRSPARKRMAILAISAGLYLLVDSGFNVIGPLWATRDLGLDNAGWAFLRSASELGGFVSVLAFGVLSERIGTRRTSALALGGAGLTLAALSLLGSAWLMAVSLMTVLGAFISTIYVNFNTLAQRVSEEKQSLANAVYRAAGASAAIVAPTLATQAAHVAGGYRPVLVAAAVLLGIAAFVILRFAEPPDAPAPAPLREVLAGYRRAFTLRPLLAFVAISRGFGIAIAAVSAFAALRFTRELHLSEPAFGALCSAIAVVNLLALLASGWIVDRLRPSRALGLAWLGCSAAAIVLGLSNSLLPAMLAYALFVPLLAMCSVPLSLWSTHVAGGAAPAGPGQATVFTVGKVFQSGTTMLVMALLGVLEPRFGMSTLMWCGGLLGLPLALIVVALGRARGI